MHARSLLHLLYMASPDVALGANRIFAGGLITDAKEARVWIVQQLHEILACWEAPVLLRMARAYAKGERASASAWNKQYIAARDRETLHIGYALARLLAELGIAPPAARDTSLLSVYACAAAALHIDEQEILHAYLLGWADFQVQACVQAIGLEPHAGQRLLLSLAPELACAARTAVSLQDDELCSWTAQYGSSMAPSYAGPSAPRPVWFS